MYLLMLDYLKGFVVNLYGVVCAIDINVEFL